MSDFKLVKLVDPIVISLPNGINWLGEYDDLTPYVIGDSVSYQGSSYVAMQPTTGNDPSYTAYWQLLAAAGNMVGVNTNKITLSDTAPNNPSLGDLWVDTS